MQRRNILLTPRIRHKGAQGHWFDLLSVWTDENLNIRRASEHLQFSGEWKDYESVVTYDWLRRAGADAWLIPRTIFRQIRMGKKVYWRRGLFTDYRIFDAQARIVASDYGQSLPQ